MGLLRSLLALSVVLDHVSLPNQHFLVGGTVAVQSFYIISGFYMAMILSEKYIGGLKSYKLFITNRFLRIFPMYWVVLVLTIGVSAVLWHKGYGENFISFYQTYFHQFDLKSQLFLLGSNLFLFGQDVVLFLGTNLPAGTLYFTKNFSNTLFPPTHYFMLVPQAWSLAIELMFYLMVPFVFRWKTNVLLALIFVGLMARVIIYNYLGLAFDPWTYRFFPTELVFFLAGILSYRFFIFLKKKNLSRRFLWGSFSALLAAIITFYQLPTTTIYHFDLVQWVYYLALPLVLPLAALLSFKNKLDRSIGELSYPMYTSHLMIIFLLKGYSLNYTNYLAFQVLAVILTVLVSFVILRVVIAPIERYRQSRVKKSPAVIYLK
jgi:peptidoglycan/LPS O-acetylase OafA/YrhL